jgi:glyoxylate utilization-related uncharacterized protein
MAEVRRWDQALGAMSLDAIRALHQPECDYRVSWNSHPAQTETSGTSRARCFYVLSGECEVAAGDTQWRLSAGEYADLPQGDYQLRVIGSNPLEFVSVWEVPEAYRAVRSEPAA